MRSGGASALSTWWRGKPPRERRTIAAFAVLVGVVLAWAGIVDPLTRDLNRSERARIDAAERLALARNDVTQMTALAQAPVPAVTDPRAALDRALVQGGLKPAVSSLEWQERRAVLTFGSVEFARLATWLEVVHRDAGLHVQEATLSRLVSPGLVRAELVLAP